MSDDRVWLRKGDGTFHCPAGAAADWQAMGWEPCDAPEEHNPVVAEMLAAQKAAAELAATQQAATTKTSRRGGADTTSQES